MDQQHSTLPQCQPDAIQPTTSVLRLLNCCSAQLERLLSELRSQSDAEPALRANAAQVLQALALDAEIALASIFLNRISGTYPVRHCVEAALVAVLLARAAPDRPANAGRRLRRADDERRHAGAARQFPEPARGADTG